MIFGIDYAMIFYADGTIGIDYSKILNDEPNIVVQRCISKILANPRDYWWLPTAGVGIAFRKGEKIDESQRISIAKQVIEQCESDPQVESAECDVWIDTTTETLTVSPKIKINNTIFTPTITVGNQSVAVVI